jgi:hypothetical protein
MRKGDNSDFESLRKLVLTLFREADVELNIWNKRLLLFSLDGNFFSKMTLKSAGFNSVAGPG